MQHYILLAKLSDSFTMALKISDEYTLYYLKFVVKMNDAYLIIF